MGKIKAVSKSAAPRKTRSSSKRVVKAGGAVRESVKPAGVIGSMSHRPKGHDDLMQLIKSSRNGVAALDFDRISKQLPFTLTEWAMMLELSERTIQRMLQESKTFSTAPSERILAVYLLYQWGVEVFGDAGVFDEWLKAPCMALGGSSPTALLDTNFGLELVRQELGRIEHGVLA